MGERTSNAPGRPSIGLVLGGGGARGLAHIGVLEALAELDAAPHRVVGVSMGAVVGGAYALRPDWSEALRAEDWSRLPVVNEARDGDLLERLSTYGRSIRRLAPTMSHWSPRRGFSEEARATLVDLYGSDARFEDCRVPFAVVTTDLRSGRRTVLGEGGLVDAVLASASIPGLARPVELDGGLLVDGGFTDPAPVDVARSLGADRVIAVHVGMPAGDEPADNWSSALLQALEAGQRAFATARFRHADLVLRPMFSTRTRMLDFSAVRGIIDEGRAAVDERRADITALLRTAA